MNLENNSFTMTVLLYTSAMFSYFMFFLLRKESLAKYGKILVVIGLLFHTLSLGTRTVEASRLPLSNQYEFATSFAWGISACFLAFDQKYKYRLLGTFVTPLILMITFYAAVQSKEIRPLMPALQSNWLIAHVSTAILSYGGFAIACAASLMFVIGDRMKEDQFIKKHMPSSRTLDMISYRAIALGFMMLTIVIISGAIWADQAWGRYWQWDPKETWSFITWVIYAMYLHVRLGRGWKDKRAAWFAILGFVSILFTYIGVNTILSGYHAYGILWINML
ncbi:cytochrome c assembly protein [Alkaliphilus metalliredigens QYMF]|uniref:Cytochrome c assembly protein n=1 Tax=Alkaliphilus metalliredigens (strain QYMF) TaxID=293826 RepID=A6TSA0_ALKMQ|nr:c-type cytochrome biogenesis protein CcsB [Alkaliphilus metalliredigens]ABR49068.1 cytochrome c assembly protein [Alkaliphilus metalliredigens QYMF]